MKSYFLYLALLLTAGSLSAERFFYLGGQAGANFQTSPYLTKRHCCFGGGCNVGLMGGTLFRRCLFLEAETTYRNNRYHLNGFTDTGDPKRFRGYIDIWSFMANGYYKFPLSLCKISPYIGAGVGWDLVRQNIKISQRNYAGNHNGFAWQLMAGGSLTFCTCYSAKLEYKFHLAPIMNHHHLQNHSVTIGVQRFFSL